jgi:hypothetical protein
VAANRASVSLVSDVPADAATSAAPTTRRDTPQPQPEHPAARRDAPQEPSGVSAQTLTAPEKAPPSARRPWVRRTLFALLRA